MMNPLQCRPPISVCMAVFNGQEFVEDQVVSILDQLRDHDELLIWDDASTDASLAVIQKHADRRVSLFKAEMNQGVNRTFETLLLLAKNNLIFTADQDDIWLPQRVEAMIQALRRTNSLLVSGNTSYIDKEGCRINHKDYKLKESDSNRAYRNIYSIFAGRVGYYGCAMLIDRKLLPMLLPFPRGVESCDLWIAMCANVLRRNCHLEKDCLKRRLHGATASILSRSWTAKLKSRAIFASSLCSALIRARKFPNQP